MLRHLVFLDIQNKPEAIASIRNHLEGLSKKMLGCMQFHFGECINGQMNHYFFMDFENEAARDHYVNHPEHVRIAEQVIIPRLKAGVKSVVLFDYARRSAKKMLSMAKGLTGYIFIKHEEAAELLEKLTPYCDQIDRLKPLQNCSVEVLGKEYPFALKIEIKPNSEPLRLRQAVSFWTLPHPAFIQERQSSHSPLKSRL